MLHNRISLLIILMSVFVFIAFMFQNKTAPYKIQTSANPVLQTNDNLRNDRLLKIGNTTIWVEVADSETTRQKGLSGKQKIADNEGMLFVSPVTTVPTFWMKDMKFALDFIWIKDDKVVDITKNVQSPDAGTLDSELILYKPKEAVNYILEVNAGFVETNKISVGNSVSFK